MGKSSLGKVLGHSFLFISLIFLHSCGNSQNQELDYEEFKAITLDILQSKEGQIAILDTFNDPSEGSLKMKSLNPSDERTLQTTVKEILVSPEYEKKIEKIMKNPKFAGEFSKVINKNNKKIHKDLMKDPQYQQALIKTFKSPEMIRLIGEIVQAPTVEKVIKKAVLEQMQNPLFKLEILKLLQEVVRDSLTPQHKKENSEEEQASDEDKKEESFLSLKISPRYHI